MVRLNQSHLLNSKRAVRLEHVLVRQCATENFPVEQCAAEGEEIVARLLLAATAYELGHTQLRAERQGALPRIKVNVFELPCRRISTQAVRA